MSYECTPYRCKRGINLLTTASEKDTSQCHDGTQTRRWEISQTHTHTAQTQTLYCI